MSQTPPSQSPPSTVSVQSQPSRFSWTSKKSLFLLFTLACLLGGLIYLLVFIYRKTKPQSPSPPPPPPSLSPSGEIVGGEVFGVEMKDFNNLYDESVQIGSDGTLQQTSGAVLTGDRISGKLPSGFSIANINQLRVASFKGMQYCAWGICISDQNTRLIGAYPIQGNTYTKENTLCGVYDPSLLNAPRVVTVTSVPSDTRVPTVLWIYGIKPKQESVFRFRNEKDLSKPGRKILPWFSPLPNQPGSVQWAYDPSIPSACSNINNSCIYPWSTTIDGTKQMYLSVQIATIGAGSFPFLSLSFKPSFGWQLLSNGYLITQVGFGNVQAVSFPTALDGNPLALVTFPSITAIRPQPPNQDRVVSPPTGGSTFTLNSSGNIVLSAFPTVGFSYGTIKTYDVRTPAIPGSYIILTTDQSKWLKFTPISFSDAINAYK